MSNNSRPLANCLLSLVVAALAAFFVAAPATAAPTSRASASTAAASALAAKPKPCGVKHYPPCPPKHVIVIGPHRVHRGGHVHVVAKHFRPHQIVKVYISGHHHRSQSLGRFVTNSHGNVSFHVTIPRRFKPGEYRLTVKIGSTVKTVTIRVTR